MDLGLIASENKSVGKRLPFMSIWQQSNNLSLFEKKKKPSTDMTELPIKQLCFKMVIGPTIKMKER